MLTQLSSAFGGLILLARTEPSVPAARQYRRCHSASRRSSWQTRRTAQTQAGCPLPAIRTERWSLGPGPLTTRRRGTLGRPCYEVRHAVCLALRSGMLEPTLAALFRLNRGANTLQSAWYGAPRLAYTQACFLVPPSTRIDNSYVPKIPLYRLAKDINTIIWFVCIERGQL